MLTTIKSIAHVLAICLVSPLIMTHRLSKMLFKRGIFVFSSQLLSMIPGKIGSYLRVGFYRLALTKCHPDTVIGFATLLSQEDTELEDGVYIGPQCNIGMCKIGKDSLIASGVHIMSGNTQHNIDDLDIPIQHQGGEFSKIQIGQDCWIGNGSLVMADIGNHCVIGAGSVVTKPLPDYSIAVGNPAKIIRSRKAPK